jgi:hypothetical protein
MGYHSTCAPLSNKALVITREEETNPPLVEPVTLQQAKAWLKMEAIDDDDDIITDLITQSRVWLETYCGITLVQRNVTAIIEVNKRLELPLGPVMIGSIVVQDINNSIVDNPKIIGPDNSFVILEGQGQFTVSYLAGYDIMPHWAKMALKQYLTYSYEHRGDGLDEDRKEYAYEAKRTAFPYRRNLSF